ncbi:MAG: efflux RND transporter periplasmic adaptor subunit [Rhodobacteraceae bacterium]|nr:efflux RND transporter periplasmic adaptor subunit [Paracoccaceae bacterium]
MRFLRSYGIAAILVLGVAIWLSTGLLVRGGLGPVDGEMTVAAALEADGGPLTDAVAASGIGLEVHHAHGALDPSLSIAERNALLEEENGPTRSVRTVQFDVQSMPLEVTLRGHTAARASVDAVAQTSDIISSLDVEEGALAEIGDLICSLDNGTRQASINQASASVAQAEAALVQAQSNYRTNQSLRERGLSSPNSADQFSAALRAAEANLEAATVGLSNRQDELSNTEVRATVAGIIQRPMAEAGDFLPMGGSCARIVQLDPMVFVGAVPQSHIQLARVGLPAEIRMITGAEATGNVSYISVSADQATRSFDVEIEFANPNGAVLDGLTAEAKISLGNVPAHLLPQSVMTLDQNGVLGVRAVEDSIVAFYPIEILSNTRAGIWVAGLPFSINVITVGQEYVTAGQRVDATDVPAAGEAAQTEMEADREMIETADAEAEMDHTND